MEQDEIWNADVARRYDTPDAGMFAAEVLEPTLHRLADLAGDGRVLEFAIGTGRVAVPLAERGIRVAGIEVSRPMVDQLRTKADHEAIPVVVGDMASAVVPGAFTLVYLVYNTLSNLLTQQAQVACLRNAARHLTPGGRFVVELRVPELRQLAPGAPGIVRRVTSEHVELNTYDTVRQRLDALHVTFDEDGRPSLFRTPHRYVWPAELDLMAQLAGFDLEARHADWDLTEFTDTSPSHVSVYRLPP